MKPVLLITLLSCATALAIAWMHEHREDARAKRMQSQLEKSIFGLQLATER